MYFAWVILPMIILALAGIYIVYTVYKGVQYFGSRWNKRRQLIVSLVISVILIAPMSVMGTVWFMVLVHMVGISLICHLLIFLLRKMYRKPLPKMVEGIYRSGAVVLVLTLLIFSYGYYNMSHIVKTEYQVTTDKNIRSEGYRLAVLSDLHYGISLDNEELRNVAERISSDHPDVLILDGDIVDESTTYQQMEDAIAILGSISTRYGIYFVYGNHDSSSYSDAPSYTVEQLENAISQAKITILDDAVADINGELALIGRADKSYGVNNRKEISQLISGIDQNQELIVLDHQPAEYRQVKAAGGDLIISGHTHAGQMWPIGVFTSLMHVDEMNYGYKKQGNLNAIVTSGIAGWGYPIRTEEHSEYVLIELGLEN